MATIISVNNQKKHNIMKYNFKVLGNNKSQDELEESFTENKNPNRRLSDVDSSAINKNSKEALIESLMQKTEEMSTNFVKLQMNYESKEEEHKLALEQTKEQSFNEGIQEGIKQSSANQKQGLTNAMEQFANSVGTLEKTAKDFIEELDLLKSDLTSAAIDIAKEVIDVELHENSYEVAKKLSDELIEELKSATKIILKVNPNNHGEISEHLGLLKHIEIVSDSAVSEGGVIAMSDAGNIDAQISKRFEKVKRVALSE